MKVETKTEKDQRLAYHRKYYKEHREKQLTSGKIRYSKNADYMRMFRMDDKKKVFDHYGWLCACCGETEKAFLSIDHKNNDGYKERNGRGGRSNDIIRNIVKQNFPDTYQILCFNCNLGKARNNGVCPHQII